MKRVHDEGVTLAIAPSSRGLGYIVFESPDLAIDWGVKEVRLGNRRDALLKARVLMHMLQPSVLVLEDADHRSSRRSKQVRKLIDELAALGKAQEMKVVRCPRQAVLAAFGVMGARSKDEIAAGVVKLVPELAARLPPRRRIWQSEHHSMAIFEAAALALTCFARGNGQIRKRR